MIGALDRVHFVGELPTKSLTKTCMICGKIVRTNGTGIMQHKISATKQGATCGNYKIS